MIHEICRSSGILNGHRSSLTGTLRRIGSTEIVSGLSTVPKHDNLRRGALVNQPFEKARASMQMA